MLSQPYNAVKSYTIRTVDNIKIVLKLLWLYNTLVVIVIIITTFIISAVSFLIGYILSSKEPKEAVKELVDAISAVKRDRVIAIRPKTKSDQEAEEQAKTDKMFEEAMRERE